MTGRQGLPGAEPAPEGFSDVARAYDTTGTEFFADLAARLLTHARIKPGDRVADLGCGAGAALIPAAAIAGPGLVTGLDASQEMVARARQAARARDVEVSVHVGDAQYPPLPAESWDVITASSVLQFLDEPLTALRCWLKLLVPGGRLAISWGMRQDPAWVPVMAALDHAVPPPAPGFEEFLRRPPFTGPAALEEVLTNAGYTGAFTHTEPVTTVYHSPQDWWRACQSQATWVVSWRHIPPAELTAARDRAFALVDGLRGSDGLIRRTLVFGCTIATRPYQHSF